MSEEPISKKQMKVIDKLYWSPSERATGVYNLWLEKAAELRRTNIEERRPAEEGVPSDWDLLCFAVEYVGQQAIVIEDEDFLNIAVALARRLYSIHYSNPGKLYGNPDKSRERAEDVKEGQNTHHNEGE